MLKQKSIDVGKDSVHHVNAFFIGIATCSPVVSDYEECLQVGFQNRKISKMETFDEVVILIESEQLVVMHKNDKYVQISTTYDCIKFVGIKHKSKTKLGIVIRLPNSKDIIYLFKVQIKFYSSIQDVLSRINSKILTRKFARGPMKKAKSISEVPSSYRDPNKDKSPKPNKILEKLEFEPEVHQFDEENLDVLNEISDYTDSSLANCDAKLFGLDKKNAKKSETSKSAVFLRAFNKLSLNDGHNGSLKVNYNSALTTQPNKEPPQIHPSRRSLVSISQTSGNINQPKMVVEYMSYNPFLKNSHSTNPFENLIKANAESESEPMSKPFSMAMNNSFNDEEDCMNEFVRNRQSRKSINEI